MEANLFNRLHATLLAVATVGLALLAVLNLRQEREFHQPDDGVWWVEAASGAGLEATKVLPDSPGQRTGNHTGDLQTALNGPPEERLADFERQLYRNDVYTKANYSITRDGIQLDSPVVVIPEPPDRSVQQALRLIGLIYLAIGIYVLFRRWTAPRATHFYLFCLVSFALYALKYTGQWDWLDKTVFWTNIIARIAAAGAVRPLRSQLPRGAAQESSPQAASAADLRAGCRNLRPLVDGHQLLGGDRCSEA